jgi:flagellar biosynthetic protein FliQ
MNEIDALDLVHSAIWTVTMVSAPAVLAAMAVGITIGLLQALTQVQEATLTFVPKIMAIFLAMAVSAHFMGAHINAFATNAFQRIESGF